MSWIKKVIRQTMTDPTSYSSITAPVNAALAASGNRTGGRMALDQIRNLLGIKGETSAAGGGGGGAEIGGGESGGMSPEQTIQQILQQYLTYNPQVAGQQYDLTAKYAPQYAAINRGMVSSERSAGIDDAARLAPRLQGIREAGDRSDIRSMRDQLYAAVLGDLSMGENLTPEQDRNAVQSVRSAQSARGLNGGQSGANIEAVRRTLSGQALGQQRRAAASSVLASEASQTPDPFATILGMPTTSTSAAINQAGAGNNALSPSMLSQAFFGATQANQAANQYNLALEIAKQNPYLYKS